MGQETIAQQPADYKSWLYRVATNRAIDYLRHKKLIFTPLPDSEAYPQFAELLVEGHEDRICNLDWLQEAIAAMSPQYRMCVLLDYYGYTHKQIAAQLGIAEKTVSANASHAKTQLQRKYYPVEYSLKQEISRIYRNLDRFYSNATSGIKQLTVPLSVTLTPYELKQLTEKSIKEYSRYIDDGSTLMHNIWDTICDKIENCNLPLSKVLDAGGLGASRWRLGNAISELQRSRNQQYSYYLDYCEICSELVLQPAELGYFVSPRLKITNSDWIEAALATRKPTLQAPVSLWDLTPSK